MTHTTRKSLLDQIKDSDNTEAWGRFVDLYGPLVFRFGKRKGLQDADASDMMQDVMQRVSQSIVKFEYDPKLGRFRSWLFLLARQCIANQLKKKSRQPVGAADSVVAELLQQAPSAEDESAWEDEYRQHVMSLAMNEIRDQFSESTWQAFFATAIENRGATEVAAEQEMSVGAVYIAKSRVVRRLKDKVAQIEATME